MAPAERSTLCVPSANPLSAFCAGRTPASRLNIVARHSGRRRRPASLDCRARSQHRPSSRLPQPSSPDWLSRPSTPDRGSWCAGDVLDRLGRPIVLLPGFDRLRPSQAGLLAILGVIALVGTGVWLKTGHSTSSSAAPSKYTAAARPDPAADVALAGRAACHRRRPAEGRAIPSSASTASKRRTRIRPVTARAASGSAAAPQGSPLARRAWTPRRLRAHWQGRDRHAHRTLPHRRDGRCRLSRPIRDTSSQSRACSRATAATSVRPSSPRSAFGRAVLIVRLTFAPSVGMKPSAKLPKAAPSKAALPLARASMCCPGHPPTTASA